MNRICINSKCKLKILILIIIFNIYMGAYTKKLLEVWDLVLFWDVYILLFTKSDHVIKWGSDSQDPFANLGKQMYKCSHSLVGCSNRSETVINRFSTKFYIEMMLQFFSQLFFFDRKKYFFGTKKYFSEIFQKIEIFI